MRGWEGARDGASSRSIRQKSARHVESSRQLIGSNERLAVNFVALRAEAHVLDELVRLLTQKRPQEA